MTDLRARITDALREHVSDCRLIWGEQLADHLADVVLSLPGIAVVELPEPEVTPNYQVWFSPIGNVLMTEGGNIYHDNFRSVDDLRHLAAALLSAADAAEQAAR